VASVVFQGPAALTLDGKGRIAMPARHRELLAAMGVNQLTLTKHPEGSLLVFPRPAWETFRDKVAALPMDSSGWKRIFLGSAMDVDIDASSRVLIAPELPPANLERQAGEDRIHPGLPGGGIFQDLGNGGIFRKRMIEHSNHLNPLQAELLREPGDAIRRPGIGLCERDRIFGPMDACMGKQGRHFRALQRLFTGWEGPAKLSRLGP